MTSVPQQADAPAVILYREETTDDTKNFRTVYVRLKILTEAGRKYAEVEIPVARDPFTISQLTGRTVHADGQIIGLEDQPIDKFVVRGHGVRVRVKAFTLPSVQVGSILDYRYSLHFPEGSHNAPSWLVQNELFERKLLLKFVPTKYAAEDNSMRKPGSVGVSGFEGANNYEMSTSGSEGPISEYACVPYLPPGNRIEEHATPQGVYKWLELDMEGVPTPIREPLMPPDQTISWRAACFYRSTTKFDDYWARAGKAWDKNVGKFLDRKAGVAKAVNGIVAPADTPETKARKIYAAISEMDNPSLSPPTAEAPVLNSGAEDILQRQSGTHDDLNRLFVAMLRAAGISATMMWLPDRGVNVFTPNVFSTAQLDGEIAVVQINGKDVFLDPGTKFCPYGILNWHYAGGRGLRQNSNGGATIGDSPAPSYKEAIIERVARLSLTPRGTMEGTLAVGFSGQEAMARRQLGIGLNADQRKKLLEDEIRGWLPEGTTVALTNTPEWEKTDGMLVAKLKVAGPLAVSDGHRSVLPLHIFEVNARPLFPSSQRVNPVDFSFAARQMDEVHITLPPSLEVKNLASDQKAQTGYALYTSQEKREGANGIMLSRDLAMNGVLFTTAEYKDLKDFYDKVAASDQEPVILKGDLQKN